MTFVSEITGHWLGLCRKPPAFHASQEGFVNFHEPVHEGSPDGGGGGSGTIRRGIGAALSGMRTLNRNRQLFWFTLLAGLVLAGNTIGQAAFYYIGSNLHMQLDWIVWQFFIELATLFCLVFLLAGLFLSIPSKKEGPASFFEGLFGAKKYLKVIFLWSLILALAGMLLVIIFSYVPAWFPTREILFLYHNGFGRFDSFLFSTLSHFPFNLSRLPPTDIFTEIPGYGGRSVLLWFYPGFREALIFSAINLLLLILTPFVVPLIVLGQKSLREAVAGSFTLMKKTWVEVAACAIFLGVVVYGVFLTYLLVQAAHGMVTPLATYYRPTDTWIALGLFYDLALFSVAFVVATVGGIAALDLYTSAKTGQIPGSPEPEPHS
jgi:hypothetical protein